MTIPSIEYEATCSICLNSFNSASKIKKLHPEEGIAHVFHEACIDKWFRQNDTCPICRRVSRIGPPLKTPFLEQVIEQKDCVLLSITLGAIALITAYFFGQYFICAVPGAPCHAFK